VAEPEANANNQEPRAPLPQEPWHDKVLVDTIGYTKGLVAILDSLSEGFQRRGRELEEHRNRLAILQSERRTLLEGRSEFDARITALTAERDGFRTTVEARERELEEHRNRLAMLQSERRTLLEGRSEFDARITALTAERDGFRTALADRQRELDDQRARLAILQDERRTSLQERSEFDARITALTAERDGLRAKVAERERELDTLRQDVAQGQAALEAQAREILGEFGSHPGFLLGCGIACWDCNPAHVNAIREVIDEMS